MFRPPRRFGRCIPLLSILSTSLVAGCWQTENPIDDAIDAPPQDATEESTEPADSRSTITTVGHGSFIDSEGNVLAPSLALFQRTHRAYLESLEQQAGPDLSVDATRALLSSQVEDPFLANALTIDWLIDEVRPVRHATMKAVNGAMRRHYLTKLSPSALDPNERDRTKGIGEDAATKLAARGFDIKVASRSRSTEYNFDCAAAGVPIPPPMFSEEWVDRGKVDTLAGDEKDALWYYESNEPPGVCLAITRETVGAEDILAVICFGTQSSKACFWDLHVETLDLSEPMDVTELVSGYDIPESCTDCHAGENPFIVHPEQVPFAGDAEAGLMKLSIFGSTWYEPIFNPAMPQNPGPTSLLSAVSSIGRCDSCHDAGRIGGRFPAVSRLLPGYCGVLKRAALDDPGQTMPPSGFDRDQFLPHIEALREACNTLPSDGIVVPVDEVEDAPFLSPPAIIDPLYACAEQVAVRGAVLDATLTLYIDGVEVGSKVARNPNQEVFDVPPLVVGQKVIVEETAGGSTVESEAVIVRDHREDYPDGLPAPSIDPTLIYECAEIIAVRHVPGAKLTVWSLAAEGGAPVTIPTSTGWNGIYPGKRPFEIGDEFKASISLCGEGSELSTSAAAVEAPSVIPAPSFDPVQTFAGQELITFESLTNGSHTQVGVSGAAAGGFTTPINRFPDYDLVARLGHPLNAGDVVTARQNLCSEGPPSETPPASRCQELPAPKLFQPTAGNDFVVVREAVPGARIRVYDDSGTEIGDGSGNIILLSRALTISDVLTAVQQVGDCTSQTGYRVAVRGED